MQVIAGDCFQLGLDFLGMVQLHRLDLSFVCVADNDVIDALFAREAKRIFYPG